MDTEVTEVVANASIIADINGLFAKRHELAEASVVSELLPINHHFVEEVSKDGERKFVSLTDRARDLDEPYAPAPPRARGTIRVTTADHFIELVKAAGDRPTLVGVGCILAAYTGLTSKPVATATLNPTLPDGTPGHDDHLIYLMGDPAPAGAAWLRAALDEKPLSIQQFQNLIYAAGSVVVPPADWPSETAALIKRLGLNGMTGLADLLAASPGVEIEGPAEIGETVDAHTGAISSRVRAPNKPRASIPTVVVIEWEPVPGLTQAVALRLFVRKSADGNGFDWHLQPIDLAQRAREAAVELQLRLAAELGHPARVVLSPAAQ